MATTSVIAEYDSLLNGQLQDTADPTATTAPIGRTTGERNLALRFDLRSFAPANISAATLTLTNIGSGGLLVNGVYYARRITQVAWVPDLATYNSYDGVQGWDTAGGDSTTTNQASCTIASATANLSFSLVALAQDAINNRSGYLHLLVILSGVATENVVVYTMNHATAANRPTLALTYTMVGGRLLKSTLRPRLFHSFAD